MITLNKNKSEENEEEEEEQLIDIDNLSYTEIEQMTRRELEFILSQLVKSERTRLLLKLFSLLKQLLTKRYANIPWDMLEQEFYKDQNILRRYILIKAFITQNYICDNRKCFTNLDLDNVAKWIDSLPTDCYDKESAKAYYGENSQNFKDFKNRIEKYSMELTLKFQEIHKIYAMSIAQNRKIEKAHVRSKDKLQLMGEMSVPYSKAVARDVDANIDEDEKILMPGNPEFQEEHGIFKQEQQFHLAKNNNRGGFEDNE